MSTSTLSHGLFSDGEWADIVASHGTIHPGSCRRLARLVAQRGGSSAGVKWSSFTLRPL
jgi:hypothetical protein